MIEFIVLYWVTPSLDFSKPDEIFGTFTTIEEADSFGTDDLPDDGEFMVLPMVLSLHKELDELENSVDRLAKSMGVES